MTPRPLRQRMLFALSEIKGAADFIEKDWNRYQHVGIDPDIRAAHDLQTEGMREAYRIIMVFGDAPEAYEVMIELRALAPALFDSVINIGRQELDRLKASLATGKAA